MYAIDTEELVCVNAIPPDDREGLRIEPLYLASSAIARIQFEDVVQWARYATNVTPTDARVADAILKALGEAPDTKHSPTVVLVRQAIFHVLDGREWNFEDDEQRVDFADQVASWLPNV